MLEVVVGVALTALLGGLLVPAVKGRLDRTAERYRTAVDLVDALADSLWTYWKLAVRVAHYGRYGKPAAAEFARSLEKWNSDQAWDLGTRIQIQVSRARRLLPARAHQRLDDTQQDFVAFLDREIDGLAAGGTPEQWKALLDVLMTDRRAEIEAMLTGVVADLAIGTRRGRTDRNSGR